MTQGCWWSLRGTSDGRSERDGRQAGFCGCRPTLARCLVPDIVLHDTYIVWNWTLSLLLLLALTVLILGAVALVKYLFFG
jgi:hypothetical protein